MAYVKLNKLLFFIIALIAAVFGLACPDASAATVARPGADAGKQ